MLRLAMCKVFKLQAMQAKLHVAQESQVEPQLHAIDCRDITPLLACAQPGRRAAGQQGSYLLGRPRGGIDTDRLFHALHHAVQNVRGTLFLSQ